MSAGPAERRWAVLLWALALTAPVGAALQPWLLPARSHMPSVPRQLTAPVILITVPGLRADRPTTPSLDRLAETGVSVPGFTTNSNDAIATLGTVFTGRCPEQSRLRASGDRLPDDVPTLAAHLRGAGLATVAVLSDPAAVEAGLTRGFGRVAMREGASADELLDAALELIRGGLDLPYFVWVDLSDLRAPYGGPDLDLSRVAPDAPAGFGSDPADYDLDSAALAARGWGRRELDWMVARYDAALSGLDAAIGRFADGLQADNELELLTLCVMGTRGECLAERDGRLFTHGVDLFQHSVNTPLILRLPSQYQRGLQLGSREQSVDVGLTLADLGARRPWSAPQGRSFAQDILYRTETRPAVFSEGLVQPFAERPATRRYALIARGYKLITDESGGQPEVYNLKTDPDERRTVDMPAMQIAGLRAIGGDWADACLPR